MYDAAAAKPQPISATERIAVIDAIRGFALLGILLMNIEAFVGPISAAMTGIDQNLRGADLWTDAAIYVFVQGKFYTLFSLLFGAGFAMMLTRAGPDGVLLYARRLLALLAIGLVHAVLIWSGDILVSYAICGFVLLLAFRNMPTSQLPWWGLGIYAFAPLLLCGFGLLMELAKLAPGAAAEMQAGMQEQAAYMQQAIAEERAAYGAGTYGEATLQRIGDTIELLGMMPFFFGPLVLGMFLLGAWLMRIGALHDPSTHRALHLRFAALGWGVGLPLMLLSAWLMPYNDGSRLDFAASGAIALAECANLLMCLGYLSTFVLLTRVRGAGLVALLAPAGRMALTLYLLQSIVCTLVFYGYGLGWFEQLSRAWQVPFSLALFALQLLFAHLWLARFRFGPAEWLWRTLTYGRLQPLRA